MLFLNHVVLSKQGIIVKISTKNINDIYYVMSPFHIAIENSNIEIVKLFINHPKNEANIFSV